MQKEYVDCDKENIINCNGISRFFYKKNKGTGVSGAIKNIWSKNEKYIAVNNVSFSIKKGEIVGLLGHNGAGKTTTLKMLSGILKPSQGKIEVLGCDPFKKSNDFLKRIALVSGSKGQLYWDLNAMDNFELFRRIYSVNKGEFNDRVKHMAKILYVDHLLFTQVRRLSLGERMKMEIIASLIHLPDIIFLDEPTIGLDIASQEQLRKFLKEYRNKYRTTIFITSHNLADISETCDRLLFIKEGKLYFNDYMIDFVHKYAKKKYLIFEFNERITENCTIGKMLEEKSYVIEENFLTIEINSNDSKEIIHDLFSTFYNQIKDIKIEEPGVEELMRELLLGGE